ncbi:MAG: DUF2917 domain-containing protein [Spirochaetes bacterium]|nr:DUF2917 domain-containing protein [Spirochaetota bacterium]
MIDTNPIGEGSPDLIRASGVGFPQCIDKDDLIAFNLDRERRLLCTSGLLWVTVQNDHKDYFLGRDRDMVLPEERKVILEAEEPSCFKLD